MSGSRCSSGVERPAQDGDYVSLDLAATVDGEEVPGGTATGLSYEVGSGQLLPGTRRGRHRAVRRRGHTFKTTLVGGELAGEEADVAVTVKPVKEKELPELDDEFAQTASEFDTLEELRADIRARVSRASAWSRPCRPATRRWRRCSRRRRAAAGEGRRAARSSSASTSSSTSWSSAGLTMEFYLQSEDQTQEEFDAKLEADAKDAVKAQLVLDTSPTPSSSA